MPDHAHLSDPDTNPVKGIQGIPQSPDGLNTQALEVELEAFRAALGGKGRVPFEDLAGQFGLSVSEAQMVIDSAVEDPPWARDLANPENLVDLSREQEAFASKHESLLEQVYIPGQERLAEKQLLVGLTGKLELALHRGLSEPGVDSRDILGALHDLRGATERLQHPDLFEEASLFALRKAPALEREIIQLASPFLRPEGLIHLAGMAPKAAFKWLSSKEQDLLFDTALRMDPESPLYPATVRALLDADQATHGTRIFNALEEMAGDTSTLPRMLEMPPLPLPEEQRREVLEAPVSMIAEAALAELQRYRRAADVAIVIGRLNGGPAEDSGRWSRAVSLAAEWSPLAWRRSAHALANFHHDQPVEGGVMAWGLAEKARNAQLRGGPLWNNPVPNEVMAPEDAIEGFIRGVEEHGTWNGANAESEQRKAAFSLVDSSVLPDNEVKMVFERLGLRGLVKDLTEEGDPNQGWRDDLDLESRALYVTRLSHALEGALRGALVPPATAIPPAHHVARSKAQEQDDQATWNRGLQALLNLAGYTCRPEAAVSASSVIRLAASLDVKFEVNPRLS